MRRNLLFLFLCLALVGCISKQRRHEKEKVLISDFLNFYFTEIVKVDSPVFLNTFEKNAEWSCEADHFRRASELGFNNMEYNTDSLNTYRLNFHPSFISKTDFPNYYSDNTWFKFKKKYPKGFYVIYSPIVNEEINKLIVSIAFVCGSRCGHDEMFIYERASNGKWKLLKKGCEGVS